MTQAVESDRLLMLPGDPGFNEILGHSLPPNWREQAHQRSGDFCFVVRENSGGVLEQVSCLEATEYALGGEWDLVGDDDDGSEEFFVEDGYWDWLASVRGF